MAYNQSPNQQHHGPGWGQPPPPPTAAVTHNTVSPTEVVDTQYKQTPYNAPQFTPTPLAPSGSIIKKLNFFSTKPSYQPTPGNMSSPVVGPAGGFFPPSQAQQHQGVYGPGPAPPKTTYNSNPIPTYAPGSGPSGYQPAGQQPVYQNVQSQGQYAANQQQGFANQGASGSSAPLAHPQPQPQHHQGGHPPAGYNETLPPGTSGSSAPPPAYTSNGYNAPPEKPTIQSYAASQPAQQQYNHPPSVQHPAPPTPPAGPQHPPPANSHGGNTNPTNTPAPNVPASNATPPDPHYWDSLIQDSKMPMGPNPKLRALFRGIASCITRECTVDHSPSCVFSPTKMAMYYATLLTYGDRQTNLFSKSQTHPSILSTLYTKLNCQHVLIPHPPNDGKRKPPAPALTPAGFEHWMMLQVLLNPTEEYQRLSVFISSPGRTIVDPETNTPLPKSLPRESFPAGPNNWVVNRYGGVLEQALASASGGAEEIEVVPDVEGTLQELSWFKKKSSDSQAESSSARAEVAALRKEVEHLRSQAEESRRAEEQSRRSAQDAQSARGEVEWLKKRLADSEAEAGYHKSRAEESRRAEEEARRSSQEVDWLKRQQADSQAEVTTLRRDVEYAKSQTEEARRAEEQSRRNAQGEVERLRKKLADSEAEVEGLRVEVQGLKRLNHGRTSSVASVGSAYTPGGRVPGGTPTPGPGPRLPYPMSEQPVGIPQPRQTPTPTPGPAPPYPMQDPLAPVLQKQPSTAYFRQQYKPSTTM